MDPWDATSTWRDMLRLLRRPLCAAASPCTHEGTPSTRTLVAFKHDAIQRRLLGELLGRFERKGLKLVGMRMRTPSRALAEEHYEDHRGKPFFERACVHLCSGPVVATVWEGRHAVTAARSLCGATEPTEAFPGTIRADYCVHWRRNLVHSSDSDATAQREIGLWFGDGELEPWDEAAAGFYYELPTSKITFTE